MKKRPVWVDYTMIIVGAFIMGFAIKNMYDPVNLVTGGVSGNYYEGTGSCSFVGHQYCAQYPAFPCSMEDQRMGIYQTDSGGYSRPVRFFICDSGSTYSDG